MAHHARQSRLGTAGTLLVAMLLALSLGTVAHASGNGTAVTYQVDIAHDGVQADPALSLPLTRKWSVTLGDAVSYPLIAEGKVFVTASNYPGNGTILYALDQSDGHIVWSQPISGTYWWSAAAYDAGRVFVVNFDGLLRAFNAGDGSLAWSATMPGQYAFSAAPTADSGMVYLGGAGSGGTLYQVSESTGAVLHTASVMNGDDSSPTLSATAVFVSYACNQTYAFSRTNLQPMWHYSGPCEGGGGATAPFAGGKLFTQDFWGDDIFDASSGALLGTWGNRDGGPATDGTTLWTMTGCSSAGCTLVARDAATGATRWSFAGNGGLYGRPIVISNGSSRFVTVQATDGTLYAVDADTGLQLWTGTDYPFADPGHGAVLPGFGAGQGLLVVPSGAHLTAYWSFVDTTAPTITVPGNITVNATSASGAVVTYSVTASDPDSPASVSCYPPSGSVFPIGTTTVSCSASDPAGNSSAAGFKVTVAAPGANCNLATYARKKGALQLAGANLGGCYLPNVDFTNAAATSANFSSAYLVGATFTGANLMNAKLASANLTGASFGGANLKNAQWSNTTCPDGTNSNNNQGTCIGHLT